jgi:hypothetical protein
MRHQISQQNQSLKLIFEFATNKKISQPWLGWFLGQGRHANHRKKSVVFYCRFMRVMPAFR